MALDTLSLGGLVFDNDKMRFTIQARREEALKLIDAGLSQRQAAKVLDVPRSTLQRDLAHFGPEVAQSGPLEPKLSAGAMIKKAAGAGGGGHLAPAGTQMIKC
jgi:hypothetical protein